MFVLTNVPFLCCRSCVSYTPNTDYVLASSLNSTHRLIPLNNGTPEPIGAECQTHSADATNSTVLQYEGHRNEKYSVASRICCTSRGDFLVSGSEDGKVQCNECS
jgi:WD40 repeat protein